MYDAAQEPPRCCSASVIVREYNIKKKFKKISITILFRDDFTFTRKIRVRRLWQLTRSIVLRNAYRSSADRWRDKTDVRKVGPPDIIRSVQNRWQYFANNYKLDSKFPNSFLYLKTPKIIWGGATSRTRGIHLDRFENDFGYILIIFKNSSELKVMLSGGGREVHCLAGFYTLSSRCFAVFIRTEFESFKKKTIIVVVLTWSEHVLFFSIRVQWQYLFCSMRVTSFWLLRRHSHFFAIELAPHIRLPYTGSEFRDVLGNNKVFKEEQQILIKV